MSTGGRVAALDGLRGLAVLSVVAGHVSGSAFPVAGTGGVTIFFVLSGYLITGILLKERRQRGRIDYKAFYARRALRLVPALGVMLFLYGLVLWIFENQGVSTYPGEALLALAYVGNIVVINEWPFGNLTHTWSLAVEEQFYLLWPPFLGWVLWRHRSIRATLGWLLTLAVLWRLSAGVVLSDNYVAYSLETNACALLAGCFLATVSGDVSEKWSAYSPIFLIGLGFAILARDNAWWLMFSTIIFSVGVIATARHGSRLLEFGPLTWFGTISYGLYLWHDPLLKLNINGDGFTGWHRLIPAGLAVLVAWSSWRFFERPILDYKRRFERVAAPTAGGDRIDRDSSSRRHGPGS